MSQAKVEKYKQEKANRKKIMKKEKRMHMLRIFLALVVGLAISGFLVWSVVDKYNEKDDNQTFTLSAEELSSLIEQNTTTGKEDGTTSANGSTEKTSTEKTSDEESSNEKTSTEKTSDEENTTEAAE